MGCAILVSTNVGGSLDGSLEDGDGSLDSPPSPERDSAVFATGAAAVFAPGAAAVFASAFGGGVGVVAGATGTAGAAVGGVVVAEFSMGASFVV